MRTAWDHGKDAAAARRTIQHHVHASQLRFIEDAIVADAVSADWLVSAVLSVANASASAAYSVLENVTQSGDNLKNRIYDILSEAVSSKHVMSNYKLPGKSGKIYNFDFALRHPEGGWLLIDSVSPHHVSVVSKYVAFSDTAKSDISIISKFAVFERLLEEEDASLLQQVADLVPLVSLRRGVERELTQ